VYKEYLIYKWKKQLEKVGVFIQLTMYTRHLFKGFVTCMDLIDSLNPSNYPSHSCCLDSFCFLFFFSPFKFDYCYALSIR